jgi:tetratricopeptide (TPR) repeat protein
MSSTSVQPLNSIAPAENEKKNPLDPIQADFDAGKQFLSNKELGQAAVSFHNALKSYEEKNDQNGIANACNQLGHVCLEKGDFSGALEHYQRAWDIIQPQEDTMSIMALSHSLVSAYRGLKEYRKALDVCLTLVRAYKRDNNPQGTVNILETMSEIYVESGDKAKAADSLRTIASIHASFKHKNIAESFRQKATELEESA